MPGSAPPDLNVILAWKHWKTACSVTPTRDALAEIAQDGQRVGVGSVVGTPQGAYIVDVLGEQ